MAIPRFGTLWFDSAPMRIVSMTAMVGLWLAPTAAWSQGKGAWERGRERTKASWTFNDWVADRNASRRLDLLYRFYTAAGEREAPRVEPFLYAAGHTGTRDGAGERGIGYGAALHFNHFVSGLTGLPTLNMVPGVFGERGETTSLPAKSNIRLRETWGGSLRLFARNQQDTAITIAYRNLRRNDVFTKNFRAWSWEVQGRFLLLPALAAEGGLLVDEDLVRGKPSPVARRRYHTYGGSVEFAMFRLGARIEKESFLERDVSTPGRMSEVRTVLVLGLTL